MVVLLLVSGSGAIAPESVKALEGFRFRITRNVKLSKDAGPLCTLVLALVAGPVQHTTENVHSGDEPSGPTATLVHISGPTSTGHWVPSL